MSRNNFRKDPATGFGVAPSPFNGIKLELGIILVLGLCLWLAADFITANQLVQILLLFCFGLLGTVWLVIRTKRVLNSEIQRKRADSPQELHSNPSKNQ